MDKVKLQDLLDRKKALDIEFENGVHYEQIKEFDQRRRDLVNDVLDFLGTLDVSN